MKYPTKAKIGGVEYPINTDYRIGIRCLNISADPDISDEERAYAIIYLLFGVIPTEHVEDFLRIAQVYLSCGEEPQEHKSRKKDMDFTQDEKYIIASFMSDYKIDLPQTNMHFWQFYTLLLGLTEHCALSKLRELRNYDVSDISDAKTKTKIIDAQRSVALKEKFTREEQNMIDEFENLFY